MAFIFPIFFIDQILEILKELIEKISGLSAPEMIGFILWNNIQASFFGIMLGAALGLFPLIALILNGYLLGVVANMSVNALGFGSLWRLLPHGIFEIPAVIIAFEHSMQGEIVTYIIFFCGKL